MATRPRWCLYVQHNNWNSRRKLLFCAKPWCWCFQVIKYNIFILWYKNFHHNFSSYMAVPFLDAVTDFCDDTEEHLHDKGNHSDTYQSNAIMTHWVIDPGHLFCWFAFSANVVLCLVNFFKSQKKAFYTLFVSGLPTKHNLECGQRSVWNVIM